MEQVPREDDEFWFRFNDLPEGCAERVRHVVLPLEETVLSMTEVNVGQVCDVHWMGVVCYGNIRYSRLG
jgi:hypothetical protein